MTRRECRTFGDLMKEREPNTFLHCCKRCSAWGHIENWTYSTRASICRPCAEAAKDELLPWIKKAERMARRWVKNGLGGTEAKFIAHVSGASIDFVQAEMAKKTAREDRQSA